MNVITVDGKRLQVLGPWRNADGRISGMTEAEQQGWAKTVGARLMTSREFDAAWAQADVQHIAQPRNPMTRVDSLHDEIIEHVEAGKLVITAKTWIDDGSGQPTNYGGHVPSKLVHCGMWVDVDGYDSWDLKVYPTSVDAYVYQPGGDGTHGHAHGSNHRDWSQLGYVVIELDAGDVVKVISEPPPPDDPPPFTLFGDTGPAVKALQVWLTLEGYPLKADGMHGPLTQKALVAWRADQVPDTEPAPASLPSVAFREARHYRKGRRAEIDCIVIHVGELAEDLIGEDTNAEALMNYCSTTKREVSWHYSGDSDSITQSVKEEDTAWHAGGGGINDRSIGIETSGYTAQTSAEWHDEYSQKMLRLVARLVADICRRRSIPVRKLGADQLKAGDAGICGHDTVRDAFGQTTHSDPGRWFPWEEFIDLVKAAM
jgi:hypothetical protein